MLAALELVSLPARWVESAIAACHDRRAEQRLPAGAASVDGRVLRPDPRLRLRQRARDLGLPRDNLLAALVSFNLGVEAGQLVIVAAPWPLAFALRQTWLYRRLTLSAGSLVILSPSPLWLFERAFEVRLFS